MLDEAERFATLPTSCASREGIAGTHLVASRCRPLVLNRRNPLPSKLVGVLQAISPQKTAYSPEPQASSETKVLP
jgi:hypothetical protein